MRGGQAPAILIRPASPELEDVILPGEVKTLLNQVIEVEEAAQANLIRRREKTAAGSRGF